MALDFFKQLGITQIRLVINSLGDKETRQAYRQALIDYLLPFESELSEDSKRRLHENPLRVLTVKTNEIKICGRSSIYLRLSKRACSKTF